MCKPKFKMMVGIIASGKSYLANSFIDTVVHSSDALREELFGDVDVQDKNNILFSELHKRIIADLKAGKDVCYDACNISSKKRIHFLKMLKDIDCEKVCYIMATPYELCLQQNKMRDREVDERAIKRIYKNFQMPFMEEGWNRMKLYFHEDAYAMHEPWIMFKERLDTIEQDNPWHTMTIGKHLDKCVEEFDKITYKKAYERETRMASLAAQLHDIGKEFCQFYKEEKGHSVFYQHHLVGAYMAMFVLKYDFGWENDDILTICNYIQWHMQPFFIHSEKAEKRFKELVGIDTYNNLKILHEADLRAK